MTDFNDMYLLAGSEELSREFNELAGYYSDYYKEIHGFRPRHMALCADAYKSHRALVEAMNHLKRLCDGLSDYMNAMQETFEGREELRSYGWHLPPETDPELAAKSAAAQAERDALRARMEYECSWEYHLEQQVQAAKAKAEQEEDDLQSWYYDKYEVA
jgi:hypothetical protein